MTVQELIAKLQTMPPDVDVIYRAYSDWSLLEADEIGLQTAEECERREGIVYRGGRYCNGHTRRMFGPDEQPVYRTVVTLPGN